MRIYMNPTGNYRMPVKYFLESSSFPVYGIDARRAEHLRIIQNLKNEKSYQEVSHVNALTARLDPSTMDTIGHERMSESRLTRMLDEMFHTALDNIQI